MARNWLRTCSLQVNGTTVPGGGPTDLRIVFSIEMDTTQSPNPARFRVYNCGPKTIAALKAKEGSKVTFSAGYQDHSGVVYIGDLVQFIGSGHETAVDSYVDLFCAGGSVAIVHKRVTKTLAAGWTPQDKMMVALSSMAEAGIRLGLVNVDLSQPKFPRGIPLIGMARQLLREVAQSKGALWSIQNDQLHIVDVRQPLQTSVVEMTPNTGMVGWARQTPDGIIVKSLINSALLPHTNIHLNQSSIIEAERDNNPLTAAGSAQNQGLDKAGVLAPDGIYTVISLRRNGDTRGGDWYDETVCVAAHGGSPNGAGLNKGLTTGSG